jgi:hypothetical protein
LHKDGIELFRVLLAMTMYYLKPEIMKAISIKLSTSKAEKSNTSEKGLLGIAKKFINFLATTSKPFIRLFRFAWGQL